MKWIMITFPREMADISWTGPERQAPGLFLMLKEGKRLVSKEIGGLDEKISFFSKKVLDTIRKK